MCKVKKLAFTASPPHRPLASPPHFPSRVALLLVSPLLRFPYTTNVNERWCSAPELTVEMRANLNLICSSGTARTIHTCCSSTSHLYRFLMRAMDCSNRVALAIFYHPECSFSLSMLQKEFDFASDLKLELAMGEWSKREKGGALKGKKNPHYNRTNVC